MKAKIYKREVKAILADYKNNILIVEETTGYNINKSSKKEEALLIDLIETKYGKGTAKDIIKFEVKETKQLIDVDVEKAIAADAYEILEVEV